MAVAAGGDSKPALTRQIQETHLPDDKLELDHLKPLLSIIGNMIFPRDHSPDLKSLGADLACTIARTSREIINKSAAGAGEDSHSSTMALLRIESVQKYSWDAKVVITLAAFAVIYSEFSLVRDLQTKDSLAHKIALLKNTPDLEMSNEKFKLIFDLLKDVMKLTHCLVEINDFLRSNRNQGSDPDQFATAAYWSIRSILVSATTFLSLIRTNADAKTAVSESWEIMSLRYKLSVLLQPLEMQLEKCKEIIERKEEEDLYQLFRKLKQNAESNMKRLKPMIHTEKNRKPLHYGFQKTKEDLEVLQEKYVLLLISDLDVPVQELKALKWNYDKQDANNRKYEVLWLPIVDSAKSMSTFHELRGKYMTWYSVDHPSLVKSAAIRYIREFWNFKQKPMLVVMDPQGKVNNLDVAPMMWIWGNNAFPFSTEMELHLWNKTSWNMEFLVDDIDPRFQEWMDQKNTVICLYGGEDINWITMFNARLELFKWLFDIPFKAFYVGNSNCTSEKVKECHKAIEEKHMGHCFPVKDYNDKVWYFWARLRSMRNSKRHLGGKVDGDNIMSAIKEILTFNSMEIGWAGFALGGQQAKMVIGNSDTVMKVFYNLWTWAWDVEDGNPDKFVHVIGKKIGSLGALSAGMETVTCSCCID